MKLSTAAVAVALGGIVSSSDGLSQDSLTPKSVSKTASSSDATTRPISGEYRGYLDGLAQGSTSSSNPAAAPENNQSVSWFDDPAPTPSSNSAPPSYMHGGLPSWRPQAHPFGGSYLDNLPPAGTSSLYQTPKYEVSPPPNTPPPATATFTANPQAPAAPVTASIPPKPTSSAPQKSSTPESGAKWKPQASPFGASDVDNKPLAGISSTSQTRETSNPASISPPATPPSWVSRAKRKIQETLKSAFLPDSPRPADPLSASTSPTTIPRASAPVASSIPPPSKTSDPVDPSPATEEEEDVDVSIPYDAAARLAYEASGDDSVDFAAFKAKFEADAVADVIAKRASSTTSQRQRSATVTLSLPPPSKSSGPKKKSYTPGGGAKWKSQETSSAPNYMLGGANWKPQASSVGGGQQSPTIPSLSKSSGPKKSYMPGSGAKWKSQETSSAPNYMPGGATWKPQASSVGGGQQSPLPSSVPVPPKSVSPPASAAPTNKSSTILSGLENTKKDATEAAASKVPIKKVVPEQPKVPAIEQKETASSLSNEAATRTTSLASKDVSKKNDVETSPNKQFTIAGVNKQPEGGLSYEEEKELKKKQTLFFGIGAAVWAIFSKLNNEN